MFRTTSRIGALALLVLGLAAAPAAAAPSTVTYAGDTVSVSGNPGTFSLTISDFTFFSCTGFPPDCSLSFDYDLSSTQGFTNNTAARCDDTSGATPPTGLDCTPIPGLTSVTGSPAADTVTSGCDFFGTAPVAVAAGDGADTVTLGCGADEVDGGPGDDDLDAGGGDDTVGGGAGNDTVGGGAGADTLSGGAGDDAVQAGTEDDVAAGDAGADSLAGGDGADQLVGAEGKDALGGGAGHDVLDGGADRDTLDGGDGNDALSGGDGRDLLLPGAGTDAAAGGASLDTVSYEDRAGGTPLRISLNGVADDGAAGELDAIAADVENVIGSPGADTISGGAGANDLDGGLSNDTIDPGAGPDFVDAGPGDDRVTARDGAQDRIECGAGVDTAITDAFDTVSNCEAVAASRILMPDVDNDGVLVPADCDDRNAVVRPGLPDKPGNNVDEDCAGGDAPFARIVTPIRSGFTVRRRFTRVTRLRVLDVPPGATIELRCRSKGGRRRGCFKGVKRVRVPRGAAEKNVKRFVRKRKLRRKARLEVRVLRADSIGKVVRYRIRKRKLPKTKLRCLPPGERRPKRC